MEESDNASGEHSQSTPSSTFRTMAQLLVEFRAKNLKLAQENAALWDQVVISALCWVKEKEELLKERDKLLSTLFMTRNVCGEFHKEFDRLSKELDSKMKEKEMEVCCLQASQIFHMMEAEKVRKQLKEELDKAKKMKLSFDKTVTQINAKWKSWWLARQKEVAAELKTLQQDCEKEVSKVIGKTAEEIVSVRKQVRALAEESQMAFKQMQTEYHAKREGKREKEERGKRLMRETRDEVEREEGETEEGEERK